MAVRLIMYEAVQVAVAVVRGPDSMDQAFVGRQTELAFLRTRLEATRRGIPQLVLLRWCRGRRQDHAPLPNSRDATRLAARTTGRQRRNLGSVLPDWHLALRRLASSDLNDRTSRFECRSRTDPGWQEPANQGRYGRSVSLVRTPEPAMIPSPVGQDRRYDMGRHRLWSLAI
jgi:hypothetical protein